MRIRQGVRTGLGHGGINCVLQTQFSSFFLLKFKVPLVTQTCSIVPQQDTWTVITDMTRGISCGDISVSLDYCIRGFRVQAMCLK